MSRGLGSMQRTVLAYLFALEHVSRRAPVTWPVLKATLLTHLLEPETVAEQEAFSRDYRLSDAYERSAKRALQTLVRDGRVLIVGGRGGPADPYHYKLSRNAALLVKADRKRRGLMG